MSKNIAHASRFKNRFFYCPLTVQSSERHSMKIKKCLCSIAILATGSSAFSQNIPLPALPKASLAMFVSPAGQPFPFEIQTGSPSSAMSFGQGVATISSNGSVSGSIKFVQFGQSSNSSIATNQTFTGTIKNPRLAMHSQSTSPTWAYQKADYLVDYVSRSNTGPNFTSKGVLVFRYRVDYEKEGSKVHKYDESYIDPKVSVSGPNGEIGAVGSYD